jgi:hypothetical protein
MAAAREPAAGAALASALIVALCLSLNEVRDGLGLTEGWVGAGGGVEKRGEEVEVEWDLVEDDVRVAEAGRRREEVEDVEEVDGVGEVDGCDDDHA